MQTGLYVGLSSQIALERRLATIADNVANLGTVGFRATGIKFEDVVTGRGENQIDFTSSGDTYLSGRAGGLRQTGNMFDFAVQGDAWFAIETPAGQVMTRDGRFTMLPTGELVTLEGYPVLDAGGAGIVLNPLAGPPQAAGDGGLYQNGAPAGALGLYTFDPGPNFTRFGNSGVVPRGNPEPIVDRGDVGVRQGFVEESNVNPVMEMTRLIMVQRAFDNITALIRDSESSLSEAVRTLGSKT